VKLQNVEITVRCGGIYVGSLVAVLKDGSVTNCDISGVNIMEPVDTSSEFSYSTYEVTVDDVIGEIRGTNEFIYGITATKIDISKDEFNHFNVPVNYNNSANHQPRGLRYEVTIPAQLPIGEDGVGSASLSVSSLRIPSSTVVKVYVHGDFRLEHQADSAITLRYILKNGEGTVLENDDCVGEFTMDDYYNYNQIWLTARVVDQAPYSGSYLDTLTFTYGLEAIA
jgi:hypothetical protein